MSAAPILELDGVDKAYGSLVVADKVSFSVARGEALGIIGPNGAGKSTLFNLIGGTVPVDRGTVRIDGRDVTRASPMARCGAGLGRSFQIPQPFGKLTVFENCAVAAAFGAGRHGREAADRVAAVLERTGLIARANVPAGGLPLLDRKRLELARALCTEPAVLLLDETAGGLTEAESHVLLETIRAVHAAGTTILWIEHVLHALTAVVSRMLVLNFGRIIAQGSPDAVMADEKVREIYLGIEV